MEKNYNDRFYKEACGVDFNTINTDEEAVALAKERNIEIPARKRNKRTYN